MCYKNLRLFVLLSHYTCYVIRHSSVVCLLEGTIQQKQNTVKKSMATKCTTTGQCPINIFLRQAPL